MLLVDYACTHRRVAECQKEILVVLMVVRNYVL